MAEEFLGASADLRDTDKFAQRLTPLQERDLID